MERDVECPVCGCKANRITEHDPVNIFYNCPICGRYQYSYEGNALLENNDIIDRNKLSSFLFYNGFKERNNTNEARYYTTMDPVRCDLHFNKFEKEGVGYGYPVHFDRNDVEAWYPRKFSEKIDMILLYMGKMSCHIGDEIRLLSGELYSCCFADRYDFDGENWSLRKENLVSDQADYMIQYLIDGGFVRFIFPPPRDNENFGSIILSHKGYERIDELQKVYTPNSKEAFVAMQFGNKTSDIRQAIREGITAAGFRPIFIDEVPHNDYIMPEILKHIRDSRFVVAELTYGNCGAYFEEGYAVGVGKEVIQLCRSDEEMHFDIKQKNTIIWNKEEEIPELLRRRIAATIE